jgi:hypothetical protein
VPLHREILRVLYIFVPFGGIVYYVLPDVIQFSLVSNDVFVVVALPERLARSSTYSIDMLGSSGLG